MLNNDINRENETECIPCVQIEHKKNISSAASSIDFQALMLIRRLFAGLLNGWCWRRIPINCFVKCTQYIDDTPNLNKNKRIVWQQHEFTKFAWLISNCNIRLVCQNSIWTYRIKIFDAAKIKAKPLNDNQNNGIVVCIFVWLPSEERIRRKEIEIRAILPCAKCFYRHRHWFVWARVQTFFRRFRCLLLDCNRWFCSCNILIERTDKNQPLLWQNQKKV